MKKAIPLESIEYAMVEALAEINRQRVDQYLKNLIQEIYGKQKR